MTEYPIVIPKLTEDEWKEKIARRNDCMRHMREEGKTLEEIGKIFNVTRQRVYQILHEQEQP